jgi:nucleotide-binding universal stress UspA family protein
LSPFPQAFRPYLGSKSSRIVGFVKTTSFQRILVASDGSREAEAATRMAAAVAETSRALVRVVHVWRLEIHHRHLASDGETRIEAQKLVDDAVGGLRALGIVADGVLAHSDEGHVGAAIAEAARQFGADLIVVGSRGLSSWRSLLYHSLSRQVLNAVDCPVLIVREAGASILHEPSRILLAVAGGGDVAPGARAALAAASTPGSRVLVAHVAQAYFGADGGPYVEPDDEIAATLEAAHRVVTDAGVPCETAVLPAGPVAHAIANLAWQWQADIVVTGCGRMSDVANAVFGSVTTDLMQKTEGPVLVAERASA